jgi:hydroxyacylglutathione hydrolase
MPHFGILDRLIVRRITEPIIAQCAYFIACPRTRQAILVDPVRDPARYDAIANEIGLTITAILETHDPSDYISGICEMLIAHSTHAYLSGETDPPNWYARDPNRWMRRVTFLKDGSTFAVGDLQARAILTPGHAAGALSISIEHPPSGLHVLLTGDALLPGGAGRTTAKDAIELRDSLHRFANLSDETIILAGHLSGSSCGRAINLPGETTLGIERRFNPVLRSIDRADEFTAATCDNQPERPTYFSRMENLHHSEQPALIQKLSSPPELHRDKFVQVISFPRTVVIDTRPWNQFTFDGVEGALHVPFDRFFAPLIAAGIASDERVVCICESGKIGDIVRALRLVGIDQIDGWISSGSYAMIERELMPLSEVDDISQHAAHEMYLRGECLMLDVRTSAEWLRGRIAGAKLTTLTQIAEHINQIPRDKFVIAYCAAGGRSSRACAYLNRYGIECATLKGGYWPWFGRDFPVEGADRPIEM